jgi:cysteine desulfurase/selenocysteine lyase
MYGPTGIGALWGTTAALAEMPTVLTGGSMITRVDYDSADYLPAPAKFEPGTPRLTQAIGWADSIRFLDDIGIDRVAEHESSLGATLYDMVAELDGVHILGTNDSVERVGLVSFAVDGVHPHDVGQYLDSKGIAVRVGHHCAQTLHKRLGVDSSTRISLGVYSTVAEVEYAVDALAQVRGFFGVA